MATASTKKKAARGTAARAQMSTAAFKDAFDAMTANVGEVIKGKDDVIRKALVCLLSGGHLLFEDVPGTGKTMMARAIATTIDASTSRIQCTPDLLPADVTGSPVLDRRSGDFVFRPGPVFANVLLADEVNRATPKTQSALLEAMAEGRVTVDGITHDLPQPFFVLATQNPLELAGTFPLPEAQLDRFTFKLSVGYAPEDAEIDMLFNNAKGHAIDRLGPIVGTATIMAMVMWAQEVAVAPAVARYIVALVNATRTDTSLSLGASSRASLAMLSTSRVLAASQGRDDVLPDDVRVLAPEILRHRLVLTPDAMLRDETVEDVVTRVLDRVKVPVSV